MDELSRTIIFMTGSPIVVMAILFGIFFWKTRKEGSGISEKRLWQVVVKGYVDPRNNSPLKSIYCHAEDEGQVWRIFANEWMEDSIVAVSEVAAVPKDGYYWNYWAHAGSQ